MEELRSQTAFVTGTRLVTNALQHFAELELELRASCKNAGDGGNSYVGHCKWISSNLHNDLFEQIL